MNSKERVIKTYNFELPDRIPVDFCADVPVYDSLVTKTGVKSQLELMEYFHIDFRWAHAEWIGPELVDEKGRGTDYFGIPREGEAFGYAAEHPLSHVKTKGDSYSDHPSICFLRFPLKTYLNCMRPRVSTVG